MITDKGFILPTYEEIYNRKLNSFKTVKPNIRETDSNLIISFLKFDAIEEYDSYLQGLTMFNNLSVYTATGSFLNAITGHLNMTWLKAKKSIGKIKIIADNGTIIPQAWGVETKSGIKFITLNTSSVEIKEGSIELDIISLETGKFNNVSAGEITEQTEIIAGVKNITNPVYTLGGADKETDTELRERYLERLNNKSTFTTEGIKRYILKNTNVKKCQVLENDTDEIDNFGRLPHSYECICFGDTDENILNALYEYKLAGIRSVGNISKNFDEISVGFTRAIEKEIYISINITTIKEVWEKKNIEIINKTIENYILEIEPAGTIYLYKIIGELYKNVYGIKNLKVKIGDIKYSELENDYTLSNKEVAVINKNNIRVLEEN